MATLTKSGRIAMAKAIKALPIYMCWGEGPTAWSGTDTIPAEDIATTALSNPLGYRIATSVQYCEVAPTGTTGTISIPSGTFNVSTAPTNHLYITFQFDFADSSGNTVREIGVMTGTIVKSTVPAGQSYFAVTDIEDDGDLLLLEYRKPIFRETGVKETFEFVVTF